MARALWKCRIQFAQASLPVALYTAALGQPRPMTVCPAENEGVPFMHRIHAFARDNAQHVSTPKEGFSPLEPDLRRTISVEKFVLANSIDPRLIHHRYFLGPDGADGAFAVLQATLRSSESAALCRWTMRRKAYWGAVAFCETMFLCVLARSPVA